MLIEQDLGCSCVLKSRAERSWTLSPLPSQFPGQGGLILYFDVEMFLKMHQANSYQQIIVKIKKYSVWNYKVYEGLQSLV